MQAITFDAAATHLNDYLGIDLTKHLAFTKRDSLRNCAVLGSLVVVYRYAEALGKRLVVHHMTIGGHLSHQYGTELDFDVNAPRNSPMHQLDVIADMIRIRDALRSQLEAFRLGFYFDYFYNTAAENLQLFKATYESRHTGASMHIGVRYRWGAEAYRGLPFPARKATKFGMWGNGNKTYRKDALWMSRFRAWDVGLLKARVEPVATTVIARDFRALDNNPPPLPSPTAV